jgi:hypothetical protein
MNRKTKTQEAAEYIGTQLGAVPLQPEELKGHYYVAGHPAPVHSPYQLRRYARQLCLTAMVHEINNQHGMSLQLGPSPWYPTIEDEHGSWVDVRPLLREQSRVRLNLHDPSKAKTALTDAFQFAQSLAASEVRVKNLEQAPDGTWFARQTIVWASKRGFLHEWKHYTLLYGASPVRTILVEDANELHRFEQWVTLDRLTKLMPFA